MTHQHEHGDGHAHHDHDVSQHDPEAAERNKVPYWGKRLFAIRDLLIERGVLSRDDIQAQIDYMDARSPANGARLVARAWVDPAFKQRLLSDPKAAWDQPAVTTYRFKNHAVRTEGWRLIRYANGDEELYDEAGDPNEWTNLAQKPEYAARKAELAKLLPTKNHPDIGGRRGQGREEGEPEE